MRYANLHTHTLFSDGADTPEKVMEALFLVPDIDLFAVTDHDTLSGIEPTLNLLPSVWERYEGPAREAGRERMPEFVAGIEMSCFEPTLPCMVHILGYFPHIGQGNMRTALPELDAILGEHVRKIEDLHRRRVEEQVHRAFDLDLDHISRHQPSPEHALSIVYQHASLKNARLFLQCGKKGDAINHGIPLSCHDVAAVWPELVPGGSKQKALLYALRPTPERQAALADLFMRDGMSPDRARKEAERLQGGTQWPPSQGKLPIPELIPTMELLKKAGARVSLAHPAIGFPRIDFAAFERHVLFPLVESGLDAIEVFYPYPTSSIQEQAFTHYYDAARKLGLKMSGGSDYHGGSRSDMRGGRLPLDVARDFLWL